MLDPVVRETFERVRGVAGIVEAVREGTGAFGPTVRGVAGILKISLVGRALLVEGGLLSEVEEDALDSATGLTGVAVDERIELGGLDIGYPIDQRRVH